MRLSAISQKHDTALQPTPGIAAALAKRSKYVKIIRVISDLKKLSDAATALEGGEPCHLMAHRRADLEPASPSCASSARWSASSDYASRINSPAPR